MQQSLHPTNVHFHLPSQYDVQNFLGKGAYGVVRSAFCKTTGQHVAIKKVVMYGRRTIYLRTLREIQLLRHFQHDNIIPLLHVLIAKPQLGSDDEVYLVQPLMPTDLAQVIWTQPLTDEHCQYFTYQILRGLKAIHSADIIHRDLKPSNLLVNDSCDLKICDFGLARADIDRKVSGTLMTEYVATRWYRAPEIMLSAKKYTKAIDIWSVGCIMAEMLDGRVLFRGRHHLDQLYKIFSVIGPPSLEDCQTITDLNAMRYVLNMKLRTRLPWKSRFPQATGSSLELLNLLLIPDHRRRITAPVALEHPYLGVYHDPEDEPTSEPVAEEAFSLDGPGKCGDVHHLKRMFLMVFCACFRSFLTSRQSCFGMKSYDRRLKPQYLPRV